MYISQASNIDTRQEIIVIDGQLSTIAYLDYFDQPYVIWIDGNLYDSIMFTGFSAVWDEAPKEFNKDWMREVKHGNP